MFETVGIRDLRNFASDHFELRALLLQRTTRFHGVYLRGRRAFALTLPLAVPLNLMDTKFQELKAIEMPPPPTIQPLT